MHDDGARQRGGLNSGGKGRKKRSLNLIKKGKQMKINIKTIKTISVHEVRTIAFRDIKTINLMEVRRSDAMGESINVKRI